MTFRVWIFSDGAIREFLLDAFSQKCRKAPSLNKVLAFVYEYVEFSKLDVPRPQSTGKGASSRLHGG